MHAYFCGKNVKARAAREWVNILECQLLEGVGLGAPLPSTMYSKLSHVLRVEPRKGGIFSS
jgi:hypothetical protein